VWIGLALGVVAVVVTAAPARADEGARGATKAPTPGQVQAARELFAGAARDEDAARWGDALDKLERVADVKLTAGVRYHIALCEEKLGRTASALEHYTEARDAAKREHNKEVAEVVRDALLAELEARVPKLTIDVPSGVAGLQVMVDQHAHPEGLWGVPVPMDPGAHRVEARAPGREPFFRDLLLREREGAVLKIELRPVESQPPLAVAIAPPSPPPAPPPKTTAAPAPDLAPSAALPPAAPGAPEPSTPKRNVLPIVVTAAGAVVLAGGGVGAYLAAQDAQSQGRSACAIRTACDDLKGPVRTWDWVALGAWAGAGVLAATSVVLWASPAQHGEKDLRVVAGPGRIAVEGTF
jgi:hypothetical protein